MESHEAIRMPDFNKTTDSDDDDEDVELVDIGVKVRRPLKDETQENIRDAHGGRIRGVYRQEMENSMILRNYLFEEGIEPYQAIERLEVYKNLMPIEGELRKLSEKMESTEEMGSELSEVTKQLETLNENLDEISEKFSRQNVQLNRMEHELSEALYADNAASSSN